ncbi:hypothetical protein F6X51_03345 [Methylobacterium planeticum]|uniref:Uncharacterized protein n=2 Tax=Methylobacterium planeticum TaxID=2615211 RepID=A0A6N6MZH5_9HYPH|nr:hypothetical protein F6X51_03345 [Methylobacterium planeticum]
MAQAGAAASRSGTEAGSRALTVVGEAAARAGPVVRRPLAGFVAQLIVSADPRLRPSRGERTRAAASLYAQAARRRA